MKKFLTVMLALMLCLLPLTGCAKNLGRTSLNGTQDTDYIVCNNGSNAVQYGNYLYFVNGYRGYDDTDATANVWGNVTKGGLYRVELNGSKSDRTFQKAQNVLTENNSVIYETGLYFKNYSPYVVDSNEEWRFLDENNNEKFIELVKDDEVKLSVTKTKTDENDNEYEEDEDETFTLDDLKYEIKNVERVVGKTIGTSGYNKGGIFIFDDFCYYASPNNERNKTGSVQYTLTDFFATKLDGSATYKLYTTSSASTSSPYAFYKRGDNVYLTVLDGTDVISVKIKDGKKKDSSIIAQNISSAVMPVNKIYDSANHNENDLSELIYTSRSATDSDSIQSGTIIECMRPDGSDRKIIFAEKNTISIETVKDGLVYYRTTNGAGVTSLRYTNLPYIFGNENFSGVLCPDISDYSNFLIVREGSAETSSDIYMIAQSSDAIYLVNDVTSLKIASETGTVIGVYGNMVYYYSGSALKRCQIAVPADENTSETIYSFLSSSGIAPSICGDMLVFNGNYDTDITNYARIYFIESGVSQFVGEVADFDWKSDEEE